MRPELPGNLELLIDLDRTGDVDRAILALGRVVELAQRGMTGTRVVPRVGAFKGDLGETLEDLDVPRGFKLLEQGPEGGTHDPATDEGNVDGFVHASKFIDSACVPRDCAGSLRAASATSICSAIRSYPSSLGCRPSAAIHSGWCSSQCEAPTT